MKVVLADYSCVMHESAVGKGGDPRPQTSLPLDSGREVSSGRALRTGHWGRSCCESWGVRLLPFPPCATRILRESSSAAAPSSEEDRQLCVGVLKRLA